MRTLGILGALVVAVLLAGPGPAAAQGCPPPRALVDTVLGMKSCTDRAFCGCGGDDITGCLGRWLAGRAAADADLKRIADNPDTRRAFLRYYAMRASAAHSAGAHDEWNIFVRINRKRTLGDQISMFFDG